MKVKKLNPSGYPEEASQSNQLLRSSVVGDGGAGWRLKALKRAKEQAAREGWNLDEVVEELQGSLGQLAVSGAARTSAPAHLRAVRDRREQRENCENVADENIEYFRDASCQHSQMREPKVHDSLSWGKRKAQNWNFLSQFNHHQKNDADGSCLESLSSKINHSSEGGSVRKQGMSANQLAAKVLQLRMKGKQEEAQKILYEFPTRSVDNNVWEETRNFKKCLVMMFAKQDMEVIFLETVMGLTQQCRHCLVECIPLPRSTSVFQKGN